MRPLEFHLETCSHLWMFNRLKEFLTREGLLAPGAGDEDVRRAIDRWLSMMEDANRHEPSER